MIVDTGLEVYSEGPTSRVLRPDIWRKLLYLARVASRLKRLSRRRHQRHRCHPAFLYLLSARWRVPWRIGDSGSKVYPGNKGWPRRKLKYVWAFLQVVSNGRFSLLPSETRHRRCQHNRSRVDTRPSTFESIHSPISASGEISVGSRGALPRTGGHPSGSWSRLGAGAASTGRDYCRSSRWV